MGKLEEEKKFYISLSLSVLVTMRPCEKAHTYFAPNKTHTHTHNVDTGFI